MAVKWMQRASGALTLGLAVLAFSAPSYAGTTGKYGKHDEVVERMMREGRDDLPVIVRYKDDAARERGKKALNPHRARLRREIKGLRAMSLKATRTMVQELLNGSDVEHVSYDAPVSAFQLSGVPPVPVSIDASGAAAARSRYGVTGAGVAVAVIDSGVQPSKDLSRPGASAGSSTS
jgi:hypothetical protein